MAFDPDNIVLTSAGLAYLQAHKAAGTKAQIGSFKLGSSNLFVPSESDINVFGTTTYIGLAEEDMFWIEYSENEVILRCCVNSDKGDFDIGSIGIFSDTNVMLFSAKFAYIHRKMKSGADENSAGGRWTFQLRLMMVDLFSLWDFSNIELRYAAMDDLILDTSAKYPFDSFYSELHLNDSFLPTNRKGYVLLSGDTSRKWYCSPFQMSYAYVEVYGYFLKDGGQQGDSHAGLW